MPNEVTPEATPQTAFETWEQLPEEEQFTTTADTEAAEPEPETEEDEAEEVETDPEPAPEKTDQEKEEDPEDLNPKGLKKRFRKLTGKIRDLETQLAQRKAPEVKQDPAAPQPKQPEGEPKEEDFETYKDFTKAITRYEIAQETKAKETAAQAQRDQAEATKRATEWKDKVKEISTRHKDYEDVLNDSEIRVSPAMDQAILSSDVGPDLVYFLAKNPAEAARIAALEPVAAIREMGKLEVKFTKAPETKTAALSKAPKPPQPVGGKAPTADLGKEPDPKNFPVWNKWKDRQEAKERA